MVILSDRPPKLGGFICLLGQIRYGVKTEKASLSASLTTILAQVGLKVNGVGE